MGSHFCPRRAVLGALSRGLHIAGKLPACRSPTERVCVGLGEGWLVPSTGASMGQQQPLWGHRVSAGMDTLVPDLLAERKACSVWTSAC